MFHVEHAAFQLEGMFHVEQMLSILITGGQFPTHTYYDAKIAYEHQVKLGKRLIFSHFYQLDSKRVDLRRKLTFYQQAVTNVVPSR